MSVDTNILSRTSLSAEQIIARLIGDAELADLALRKTEARDGVTSTSVTLKVRPWDSFDEDALLEHGLVIRQCP